MEATEARIPTREKSSGSSILKAHHPGDTVRGQQTPGHMFNFCVYFCAADVLISFNFLDFYGLWDVLTRNNHRSFFWCPADGQKGVLTA